MRSLPKYSDEQKNTAVEHYVNHGQCFAFTRRALGYPARQKLSEWVRERYHSYVGEISPAPENLINRDFQATALNEKWLTDISEFHIPAAAAWK